MEIILLRHGEAEGNIEKRFIGRRTDALLTEKGKKEAEKINIKADICYSSHLSRAASTARIVFNGEIIYVSDLEECDFGLLEGKNHEELKDEPFYKEFLDGGGEKPYPGGEQLGEFLNRSYKAFKKIYKEAKEQNKHKILVLTHGGVIMGIMSGIFGDKDNIYSYYVDNLCGYRINIGDGDEIPKRNSYRPCRFI